jgi:hypothetical protein
MPTLMTNHLSTLGLSLNSQFSMNNTLDYASGVRLAQMDWAQ